MLESGLMTKNTTEILTKNIALYSISCLCYMIIGYNIMYSGDLLFFLGEDNTTEAVLKSGGEIYYSYMFSTIFSKLSFVATACSIISDVVAERMKLCRFYYFV